jgi:hypothetical protein
MLVLSGHPLEHVLKLRSRSIRVSGITAKSTFTELRLKGASIKERNGARMAYSTIKYYLRMNQEIHGSLDQMSGKVGYYVGNKIDLNTA